MFPNPPKSRLGQVGESVIWGACLGILGGFSLVLVWSLGVLIEAGVVWVGGWERLVVYALAIGASMGLGLSIRPRSL